jgi:hypothetical protein
LQNLANLQYPYDVRQLSLPEEEKKTLRQYYFIYQLIFNKILIFAKSVSPIEK